MELLLTGTKCHSNEDRKQQKQQQEVIFLTSYQIILSRSHYVENLPIFSSKILELNLQHCSLQNISVLSKFIHLKSLCLSNNCIDSLPSYFQTFHYLLFCDVSSNQLNDLPSIEIIQSIPSLKYLNLQQNNVTTIPKYRKMISKLCPSLLGLDLYIISDEERYPNICSYKGTKYYKSCSNQLYLESFLRVSYPKQSSSHLIIAQHARLHALQTLAASTSPLHLIKKYCKKWMRYSGLQRYIPQLIRLQALIRRFIFHCRINKAVEEYNLQNSELDNEYRLIHYGYLTKFVVLIQRQWRVTCRRRKEYQCATFIQRWYRRAIIYHQGCVKWLQHNQVTSLIFPSKYEGVVLSILQELINKSPQGSITREILESVVQNKEFIQPVVLVQSKRKLQRWDGTKSFRIEFLFVTLPQWRHTSNQTEFLRKKQLPTSSSSEMSPTIKRKTWFFSPCICYASKNHRRLLYLIKRRGCHPLRNFLPSRPMTGVSHEENKKHASFISLNRIVWNSRGGGQEIEAGKSGRLQRITRQTFLEHQKQKYSFWTKAYRISQLIFPPMARRADVMWKIYKRLRTEIFQNVEDLIPLYFNHQMTRQSSVIEIQRVWRGYVKRKQISQKFIEKIIISRSTILLQRWWRYHNSMRRRFDLLAFIDKKCHEICDKRLYLDSLIFYRLLRIFQRPQQSSLKTYPEYHGIPILDSVTGCVVYQPLLDVLPFHDQHNSNLKHCIPLWASWRPVIQLPAIKSSTPLNNYHTILKDLISSHCEISLEHFPVGSGSNSESKSEFRVIELVFSSISEAKIRCAMLMLQTYDCVSRSCVSMMTRDYVKKKIREQRANILAGPFLNGTNVTSELAITATAMTATTATATTNPSAAAAGVTAPPTANDFPIQDNCPEIIPVEGQIILSDCNPAWLYSSGSSILARDMIRYRFLCESLSKRNTFNSRIDKEPVGKDHFQEPKHGLVEPRYEKLREMIVQQLQPPLAYDSLRTHRLEAVPFRSPMKGNEKVSDVTIASIDERLQRHLWESKRVVSWCADFPEEHKGSAHYSDDQASFSNVERVVASRLDLIQHSQYEKMMSAISPRRSHILPTIDIHSWNSSSPLKIPVPPPVPMPVPGLGLGLGLDPLSDIDEGEGGQFSLTSLPHPAAVAVAAGVGGATVVSPRPLSPNNPRLQWEKNHRKKIQEIRQKNFITQQDHQKKVDLLQQTKESQCQITKNEQIEKQVKVKEWKEKRAHSAHATHLSQQIEQNKQKEEKERREQERKLQQIQGIREQKKIQKFQNKKKKEIHDAHVILFAMSRHSFKNHLQEQKQKYHQKLHDQNDNYNPHNTHNTHNNQQQTQTQTQTQKQKLRSQSRPQSATATTVTTSATVKYNRIISEFEERILQQHVNNLKYHPRENAEDRIDNDSLSSDGSTVSNDSEILLPTYGFELGHDSKIQENSRKISIEVNPVDDNTTTDNSSNIDLGSPRDLAKIRQDLLMKQFPSFKEYY